MSKKCTCDWCKDYSTYKRVMRSGTKKELRDFLAYLFDEYSQQQEDCGYMGAILDGSWPSAVEQLTMALAVAKRIAKARELTEEDWAGEAGSDTGK